MYKRQSHNTDICYFQTDCDTRFIDNHQVIFISYRFDCYQSVSYTHLDVYKRQVLGVGMPDGAPIPIEGTNDYRRDREGNVIVTRLNEAMCQEIAKEGKDVYKRQPLRILPN